MAEHDDRDLSARYRALPDEAPPAALDAVVLDAARRDVAMRRPSGLRRWSLPVSLAAVVVLSVLVTLRVEEERPAVDALRGEVLREQAGRAAPAPQVDEKRAAPVSVAPAAPPAEKKTAPASAPSAAARQQPPASTPPAENQSARGAGSASGILSVPAAPAPAPADPADKPREDRLLRRESAADRAKVEAAAPASAVPSARMRDAQQAETESPRAWLERIARLRREGRIEEADKALEAFRRQHPDYEIPEAMREAVLGPR